MMKGVPVFLSKEDEYDHEDDDHHPPPPSGCKKDLPFEATICSLSPPFMSVSS